MSLAKMLYSQICMYCPFLYFSVTAILEQQDPNSIWFVYVAIISWFLGTLCFGVSLFLGEFSSLNVDKSEESDVDKSEELPTEENHVKNLNAPSDNGMF